MTESNPPFPPFIPPSQTPPIQPETEKQAKARIKREAKAAAKGAEEPRQRRKAPNGTKTAPKFELQTILAAASTLNADDYPLFEKVINLLDEAGKPGRERLMAAITKVFA